MMKYLFPFWWMAPRQFDLARDGMACTGLGTWAAVVVGGSTLIGTGLSMYGANKQAQDTRHTQDLNMAAQKESERQNWLRYLNTRGINAAPGTQTGELPGFAPGAALNTRLPLWATLTLPGAAPGAAPATKQPFLIKKGA